MPYTPDEIIDRYLSGATAHPNAKPLDGSAAAALQRRGVIGARTVRDSARREWKLEAHRDPRRGRLLVFRPAHGDLEPFRASADGYRPDAFLAISDPDWTLLALLAGSGDPGDDELAAAAFPVVDRLVREAQHRLLMGASEDEDDDDA